MMKVYLALEVAGASVDWRNDGKYEKSREMRRAPRIEDTRPDISQLRRISRCSLSLELYIRGRDYFALRVDSDHLSGCELCPAQCRLPMRGSYCLDSDSKRTPP